MPLFTDGPLSAVDDLTALDSQLLEVAGAEGIDVSRKLAAAQEELGVDVSTLLARVTFVDQPLWLGPKPDLTNVVVTPPLKLWHEYRTLEMVYKDAYNSQLNDRYAGKRDQFHQMAEWAAEKLVQIGIGIAAHPVHQASTPEVEPIPGAVPDGSYSVTCSWVNESGEEGASAAPAVVSINGSGFEARPGSAPAGVTGWNVFIGAALESMVLQNPTPLALGQAWQQVGLLVTQGRMPGSGQQPTYLKPVPRVIQRG
jgi:hypothetical protein